MKKRAHNHCRNPDGSRHPWCYVKKDSWKDARPGTPQYKRFALCNVESNQEEKNFYPYCDKINKDSYSANTATKALLGNLGLSGWNAPTRYYKPVWDDQLAGLDQLKLNKETRNDGV